MSAISFSVSRFAMGGLAMCLILYFQHNKNNAGSQTFHIFPAIDKKDWPRLLFISLIGATLAPWLGIEGLALTYGARASIWLALGPAVSVAIGYMLSTERLGTYGYIGIALAVIGTLILALGSFQHDTVYWLGDLLLVTALALTVIELHLIKPLARKYGSAPIVTLRTVIGCSLYLLIAMPSLVDQSWLSLSTITWFAILAGGGIGVGFGMWIKVRALHKLGPTQVVIYGNLVPIAALLIAWLSIGTNPTMMDVISAVFIVSGAILLQIIDTPAVLQSDTDQLPTQ